MKILHIFPGKVWGGAEQYVLDLGSAMRAKGHTVDYVTRPSLAVTSRLEKSGENFRVLKFGGMLDRSTSGELRKILSEGRYDVVHIHDVKFVTPVARAIKRSGSATRLVLTRHIARASRTYILHRRYFRSLHKMIFVSGIACRKWREANRWFPAEGCTVIHNSIPDLLPEKADRPVRTRYGIAPDIPVFMFTGRVRRSKGCETILSALGSLKHRKWAMVFVGSCKPRDYQDRLMKQATELGIADRVHFYGYSSSARSLLGEAYAGLQPSIVREACPLSPMEFMQQEKCVITTDNGGQTEYITDGRNGILISPDNPEQLAEAIGKILDHPDHTAEIGRRAAEHFNTHLCYSKFIDAVIKVYSADSSD